MQTSSFPVTLRMVKSWPGKEFYVECTKKQLVAKKLFKECFLEILDESSKRGLEE